MKSTHQAVKLSFSSTLNHAPDFARSGQSHLEGFEFSCPPDFWSESSWFGAIAQQSSDLIGVVSRAGKWHCLNPSGKALIGAVEFNLDERGQQLWHQTILPRLDEVGEWRGKFALLSRSGLVWFESQWFVIRDRSTQQSLGFATISRVIEPSQLESPQALAQGQDRHQQKTQFLADTAHELRSPLSVISTSIDLLQTATVPVSDRQRKHFQRIRAKIKQMAQMLEDVLVLSRTEQTEFAVCATEVDPVQFCAELVEEAQANTTCHEIVFSSETTVQLAEIDLTLFQRIVANLLSNGIKYSPGGGKIECKLQVASNHLILQVADQGIGIPTSEQSRLFQSFYRAQNASTIPGTGLGLAIVKRCVDLLGGEIAIQSAVGVGTCFTVQVPI
ncbi:MAG: HAMP domain-containing histidine kinase [Leptolyngbya sp. Prado105]|jgi:signal transduction histidine kinase|nr:HAMP domain-containing histidine kinase [Leptolyngbya sp. Prado105]